MNRDELKTTLLGGVCNIRFTKVDGTIREMRCTLKSDLVPETESSDKERKVNESVLPVWDLEKEGWRSFRIDSVIDVQPVML